MDFYLCVKRYKIKDGHEACHAKYATTVMPQHMKLRMASKIPPLKAKRKNEIGETGFVFMLSII